MRPLEYGLKGVLLLACAFSLWAEVAAAKDFRGLFGSYRREKFTENEARSTDFGFDIGLSSLIPLSGVVNSSENAGAPTPGSPLNYSLFFNYDVSAFVTFAYRWEVSLSLGYYSYSTRKQNTIYNQPTTPLFQQFDMDMVPAMLGVKYRLSREDIVPYVGVGGGIAYIHRKGYFDYSSTVFDDEYLNAVVAQVSVGLEFYFASRAGIRLEASAYYIGVPSAVFNTGAAPNFPVLIYQANPISMRYASGLFFLF